MIALLEVDGAAPALEMLGPEHTERLLELFRRVDCPCYCQYPGFAGDHREWQDRCANRRDESRAGLARDIEERRTVAVVATTPSRLVGYMRVAPAAQLPKTYGGRVYRGLPCFTGEREHVWAVSCFLIDSEFRHRGLATSLLARAIEHCRGSGVRALEAFPRGQRDVSDEEHWTGPLDLYERAGFRVVNDFAPYPVLRLDL